MTIESLAAMLRGFLPQIVKALPAPYALFDRRDPRYQLACEAAGTILGQKVTSLYKFPAYRVVVTSYLVEFDEAGNLKTIWLARDKKLRKYKGVGGNPNETDTSIYGILDRQWQEEIGLSLFTELGEQIPEAFTVQFFPQVKNQTYEAEGQMQAYFAIPFTAAMRAKVQVDDDEIGNLHAFNVGHPALTDPDTYGWPDIDLAAGVYKLLTLHGIQPQS